MFLICNLQIDLSIAPKLSIQKIFCIKFKQVDDLLESKRDRCSDAFR